jgi:glycosyltransferase involved in cell wall biosynthesis
VADPRTGSHHALEMRGDGAGFSLPLPGGLAAPARASRTSRETVRRVLVVAPEPFYEDRGTPIAVRNVLQALSELQCQVDLLTYPVGQRIEIPGVRVIRVPNLFGFRHVPVGFSLRKVLLDIELTVAMWALLLRPGRYWCVHAVEESAFPAVVLAHWRGLPVIYDMQSSLPEQMVKHRVFRGKRVQGLLRRCEAWLLRRADAVVSSAGLLQRVSEVAPGKLAQEWHFPSTEAAPRQGAGTALRAELGIPAEAPVVVYAGTFEPYQGLAMLLASIPRVLASVPDAVFVFVGGDDESVAKMREDAQHLRLNGALRLTGRRPRAEMPAYLAMADLLVSPRVYGDNLPLKVFDYLAAGRPIVATDLPAHRALLDESRAILAEPSADGLAQGIVSLLRNPQRAARLAIAARSYAGSHLGWNRFVVAVQAVYEEAARRAQVPVAG